MSEGLNLNHSSKPKIVRVNSRKKQAKITFGITISPKLLTQTRNHNLNTSETTEQALLSLITFLKKMKPKALNFLSSVLSQKKQHGPVVQFGMNV
jgi:hypothetical protein